MRKRSQGQKDFIILWIVGLLVYEWLNHSQLMTTVMQWLMENDRFGLLSFLFLFFIGSSIYCFRRWKEQTEINSRLRRISMMDELTGLYNRRGFLNQAAKFLRRNKMDIFLLYADLDNMKWINDQLGHHIGDAALIKTAQLLRESFSKSVAIARLGGDEFAILIQGMSRKLVDRMIRDFQSNISHFNSSQQSFMLSISVGVAHSSPKFSCTLADLMSQADSAMYEQKMKNKEYGENPIHAKQ